MKEDMSRQAKMKKKINTFQFNLLFRLSGSVYTLVPTKLN
jgi:hypothetical protein